MEEYDSCLCQKQLKGVVLSKQQVFLKSFFNSLSLESVRYVVLRGYESLPESVENDLDIYIPKKDQHRAIEIIYKYSKDNDLIIVKNVKHFGVTKILIYIGDYSYLAIDIFENISWKGMIYCDNKLLMTDNNLYNGICVLREGVEGSIVLLKELLMHGIVKERNDAKKKIQNCLSNDKDYFLRVLFGNFPKYLVLFLYENIKKGNWSLIEDRLFLLRFFVILANIKAQKAYFFYNIFSWIFLLIKSKFTTNKGCFVAVIGPDGSGKTTLVERICSITDKTLFSKTNHLSSNFGILPQLSTFVAFFKFKNTIINSRNQNDFQGLHSGMKKPNSLFRSILYVSWYSLDLILGRVSLYRKIHKGELIFFARYFYDYYYQLSNSNLPKKVIQFFHIFIPKPGIVFYINREPECIYRLKPELSIDEIRRQQSIINDLAKKHEFFLKVEGQHGVVATADEILFKINVLMANRI
jgi:thymidylate kinase